VRLLHNLEPPVAGYFFFTEFASDGWRKNFRTAPGQGIEPRLFETEKYLPKRKTADPRKIIDFHGGEGLQMEAWRNRLHRTEHLLVTGQGEVRMETSYHVDLRGPLPKGLLGTGANILKSQEIGARFARVTSKGAKTTVIDTDIGIIDMPVYVIIDASTVFRSVGKRRQFTNLEEVLRFKEEKGFGIAESPSCPDLVSNGIK